MKIITVPIAAKRFIQVFESEGPINSNDIKNNKVYIQITHKEVKEKSYWLIETPQEYEWFLTIKDINIKNVESAAATANFAILAQCPKETFNPMRAAYLTPSFNIKKILESAQQIEKKAQEKVQQINKAFPATNRIDLLYILSHLPKKYEEYDGKIFQPTILDQLIAKLLLSFHWLDGGGWQLAGDLMHDPKSIQYYMATGLGAGSVVFMVALIEGLAIDLPKVTRGDLSLGECLRNVFGNASIYGVACTFSNAIWLLMAEEANKDGQDKLKAFTYTGFGCAAAFLTASLTIMALYRALGYKQPAHALERMYYFFKHDVPKFFQQSITVATSAATFCFILFPEILGIKNILEVNPTDPADRTTNILKSAATTYIGFYLGEIIQATVKSLIPVSFEKSINEEKIIKELTKQILLEYPRETNSLLIRNIG